MNYLFRQFSLGPFNVPLILIPVFAAWFLYQLVIKRFYREKLDRLQRVDRLLFNSLFIVFIVWKLSPILFQFSTVIKNPSALVYLPGGVTGLAAGIAAAAVLLAASFYRQKGNRRGLAKNLAFNLAVLLVLFAAAGLVTGIAAKRLEGQGTESAVTAGREAPGFVLQGIDGLEYRLADYRGKTVVLNFWASWCPPCKAELPELKAFYKDLNSDEAVLLAVNLYTTERDPSALPAFIEEEGMSFPVPLDVTGQTAEAYNVRSIPTTVIINGEGVITAVKNGAVTESWLSRAVR
jgi:peroxiredoxin